MRRSALAAAILEAIAGPAAAICDGEASNAGYKDCLAERAEAAESELAMLFGLAMREIEARDALSMELRQIFANRMRAGQRAFRSFVEIDCVEVTLYEWWGGSGAGGAVSLCRHDRFVARSRDLLRRYDLDPALAPVATAGMRAPRE